MVDRHAAARPDRPVIPEAELWQAHVECTSGADRRLVRRSVVAAEHVARLHRPRVGAAVAHRRQSERTRVPEEAGIDAHARARRRRVHSRHAKTVGKCVAVRVGSIRREHRRRGRHVRGVGRSVMRRRLRRVVHVELVEAVDVVGPCGVMGSVKGPRRPEVRTWRERHVEPVVRIVAADDTELRLRRYEDAARVIELVVEPPGRPLRVDILDANRTRTTRCPLSVCRERLLDRHVRRIVRRRRRRRGRIRRGGAVRAVSVCATGVQVAGRDLRADRLPDVSLRRRIRASVRTADRASVPRPDVVVAVILRADPARAPAPAARRDRVAPVAARRTQRRSRHDLDRAGNTTALDLFFRERLSRSSHSTIVRDRRNRRLVRTGRSPSGGEP